MKNIPFSADDNVVDSISCTTWESLVLTTVFDDFIWMIEDGSAEPAIVSKQDKWKEKL